MGFAAALPALVSVAGGIAGNVASSGDRAKAYKAAQDAYNQLLSVGAPPDLSKQIILEQFKQAGTLTPDLEQYINTGPSQVANMQEDPAMRNAQMLALSQMQQRANGGMQPSDYAAYIQAEQQIAGQGQAKQNQILQEMASRGLEGRGTSGAELAARLSGAQNANNQQMQAGLNVAGQASQNALNAIAQSANMAGNVRNTDFSQALQKAQAADAFKQFNTQNQIGQQSRNIAALNAAQQYNLQNAQNISNANVAQNNNELYREAEAARQYWEDQMQQAQAKSNALLGQSGVYNSQAQNTASTIGGVAGGVSQGIAGYLGQQKQDDYFNRLMGALQGGSSYDASATPTSEEIGNYQLPDYTQNSSLLSSTPDNTVSANDPYSKLKLGNSDLGFGGASGFGTYGG